MSIAKIFQAWFLTVVVGSIFFAFIVGIGTVSIESFPMVFIISFILSTLFSLPTVLVLTIVHKSNEADDFRMRFKKITIAHFIMLVITILVGYFLTGEEMYYPIVVLFYALVGAVVWFRMFRRARIEAGNTNGISL